MHDHLYYVVTGAGTARRAPEILERLARIAPRVVVLTTPNAARIVAGRELALVIDGQRQHRIVESYFDDTILPRPPHGVVLVAPCSFDSLNKLAAGIADNLALSVVAEAIGRGTPVVVAVSVNVPLWKHPIAQRSAETLRAWGVRVLDPIEIDGALTLAPTDALVDAIEPYFRP